jgi:murein DD-endopeptidase MepM/ murein hydrolase activator NlpD
MEVISKFFVLISTLLVTIFSPHKISSLQNVPIQQQEKIVYPVDNFSTGITKKPFGVYVTDRFTGFHAGVDVEQDGKSLDEKIPVYAIFDGEIVYSGWVSGYGGVAGLKFSTKGKTFFALYGHLNVATILKIGAIVKQGDILGYLGKGSTQETDFERRHLHFGIITGPKFDLRGYVQSKDELSNWLDPQKFWSGS